MTLAIPSGVQISLDNVTWYKLSDHNRSPIKLSYDITEQSQRMANGKMRKYVIAKKLKIATDWKDLPTLDSNLVDYTGSTATTVVSAAPTSTSFIPAPALLTQTVTATAVYAAGETTVMVSGSTIPFANSLVTFTNVTTSTGRLANGTYTVKSVGGTYSGLTPITILTPGVTVGSSGLNATMTWVSGTQISVIMPGTVFPGYGATASDTWFSTNLTNTQLKALISVGTSVTIFGATNNLYNNTFTVSQIQENSFLVTGLTSPYIYLPSSNSTYFIAGSYANPGSNSNVPTTLTTYSSPFGGAWLKSFYESNVFFPIYVKLIYAQDTNPALGYATSPTSYTDSLATSGQTINAFITSFSYDITKRRADSVNKGYDYVDIQIEFTEI